MDIISQFREEGLVKKKTFEDYIDKETEKAIKKQYKKDSEEETTTANVATSATPVGMVRRTGKDHNFKWEGKEEKCEELIEIANKVCAAYKRMTGKNLHELFCPKCKPFDLSPATPDKGEKFGPAVPSDVDTK